MVSEDDTVILKTGVAIRAEHVVANLEYLRAMLGGHPKGQELIADFYHFCRGDRELVRPDNLALLIQHCDLLPQSSGELRPDEGVKQVLLAALHQTVEGIVLVNPAASSEKNRDALARAGRKRQKLMKKLVRSDEPERDESGGPGR